ncbi:MAG: hypothetical protein ACRDRO_27790, partial [Pseudonocardiaceae bacterium]
TAQMAAAALAAPEVAQTADVPPARVVPAAFAGIASDGRSLAGLLFAPTFVVITALALRHVAHKRALAAGAAALDMIVRTQVADAHRVATGVAVAATPELAGYERVVHLPACGRCIVLAGRLYRWSQGFTRHPRCDCTMIPVTHAQFRETNLDNHPRALFDKMDEVQQAKAFTAAGAQAIRDGADISQVVSARQGMNKAGQVQVTTSGATRRGTAGKRLGAPRGWSAVRLMPESIYAASSSRTEAIAMLRQHGYIL